MFNFNKFICFSQEFCYTLAMPTLHLTQLHRSPATPVTIVTAVDGGVGADAMDHTPCKCSQHRVCTHKESSKPVLNSTLLQCCVAVWMITTSNIWCWLVCTEILTRLVTFHYRYYTKHYIAYQIRTSFSRSVAVATVEVRQTALVITWFVHWRLVNGCGVLR